MNRDVTLQYLLWISKANAGKPILLLGISSPRVGMTLSKLKRKTLAYGQSSCHHAPRDFANP
jgi:hypothetical protein